MSDVEDDESVLEVAATSVQRASSQRLSYSTDLVYQSSKKRVTVLTWFIDRTAGRAPEFKIQTEERKQDPNGLLGWEVAEKKSVTLTEAAAAKLVEVVRRGSPLAREQSDGDFIIVRVQDGVADVANLAPETVSRAVASILRKREVVDHLANHELGPELVNALRGAIRIRELRSALSQLKHMLDNGVVKESEYQQWCSKHAWAFGSATLVPDSVRQIALGDQVDFLVPSSLTGLRDLIELKRPDAYVLNYDSTHKNWHWSTAVAQALGQCHRYLDALHESAGKGLRDHPEIIAYHPRATVVIGRSSAWNMDQLHALHGLNARLNSIQIMTYDQLIAQGERVVESVTGTAYDNDDALQQDVDDDVPPF